MHPRLTYKSYCNKHRVRTSHRSPVYGLEGQLFHLKCVRIGLNYTDLLVRSHAGWQSKDNVFFGKTANGRLTDDRGGIQFASDPNVIETDGTIGELLPNLEAMVVDESGQALDRNVDGEIWIRNPFRMKGYSKQPEAMTAQVVSEDGWIKTGDIGRVDSRNRWYMKGRSKVLRFTQLPNVAQG